MKTFLIHTRHYRPCVKAVALVVFVATPGSMLALPLVAWWIARKAQLLEPAGIRS